MKKLEKLGKVLSTKEQKNVNGGYPQPDCPEILGLRPCGWRCCLIDPVLPGI